MNDAARIRERALWLALVAVLATSLLWLTAVAAFAVVQFHAPAIASALAIAHAITRVAFALAPRVLPLLSLVLVGGMMLVVALRPRRNSHPGARHV
jgi:hypothetical protein